MSVGGRIEALFTVPSSVTIAVTNNGGGPTTVTIAAGAYTMTSFCAYFQTALTAQRAPSGGSWSVSLSTGRTGTGLVTIAMSSGTFTITWTSTTLRDLLGFTATISAVASATGAMQARGVWLPDCPMFVEGNPQSAPRVTDSRAMEGPTGTVVTLVGTSMRVHKTLRYSHVAQARTWIANETTTGASLEQWLIDTQWGAGHAWFSVGSAFLVYWDNNGTEAIVGADLNAGAGPSSGWCFSPAIDDVSAIVRRVGEAWLGRWAIEFPRMVASG